jgi:hypothetical protein
MTSETSGAGDITPQQLLDLSRTISVDAAEVANANHCTEDEAVALCDAACVLAEAQGKFMMYVAPDGSAVTTSNGEDIEVIRNLDMNVADVALIRSGMEAWVRSPRTSPADLDRAREYLHGTAPFASMDVAAALRRLLAAGPPVETLDRLLAWADSRPHFTIDDLRAEAGCDAAEALRLFAHMRYRTTAWRISLGQ